MPLPPAAEHAFWYSSYFATEYGRAGYTKYTHDFNKLTWQLASPKWNFDDATFERSAVAFDNPDHVDIVIHNYRWRLSLADGEAKYEEWENKLAEGPKIGVPTITMEGDANGALHLDPSAYAGKFTGKYEHRTLTGGIGHNLPQEAPAAFAKAIIDADKARPDGENPSVAWGSYHSVRVSAGANEPQPAPLESLCPRDQSGRRTTSSLRLSLAPSPQAVLINEEPFEDRAVVEALYIDAAGWRSAQQARGPRGACRAAAGCGLDQAQPGRLAAGARGAFLCLWRA